MTSLNRLTLAILIGFMIVAVSLTYWSIIAPESMLARPDNPRLVEVEQAIQRGIIFDRAEKTIAQTVFERWSPSGKPVMRRDYPYPEVASAIGYYSLTYGVGGVEAAFDPALRGDDRRSPSNTFIKNVLHNAQVGSDLKLTLDLQLQIALAKAFGENHGAAVVIEVSSGDVLAMVSAPSFDPNQLNQTYETLKADPNAPLLNRVTQGIYQPGGALQTMILAAMLTAQTPLDAPYPDADKPVQINDLTLTCAVAGFANNLQSAYAQGCPYVFTDFAVANDSAVSNMIDAFGLLEPPPLVSFETVSGRRNTLLTAITDPEEKIAQAAGQGDLTVTPLQMVLAAAAIANGGKTVTPHLVEAVRAPGEVDWKVVVKEESPIPVVTIETADLLKMAMLEAVKSGAAKSAQTGVRWTVYGHASIAYTGEKANTWFIGFATLPDGRIIAAAVVVEQTTDTNIASTIGGIALSKISE